MRLVVVTIATIAFCAGCYRGVCEDHHLRRSSLPNAIREDEIDLRYTVFEGDTSLGIDTGEVRFLDGTATLIMTKPFSWEIAYHCELEHGAWVRLERALDAAIAVARWKHADDARDVFVTVQRGRSVDRRAGSIIGREMRNLAATLERLPRECADSPKNR